MLGLPTMLRPVKQYVKATLNSLLRHLSPVQRNATVILLFLADEEAASVEKHLRYFFRYFREEIESGLIEIIVPDRRFYATLATAPCGFSNSNPPELLTAEPCRIPYLR